MPALFFTKKVPKKNKSEVRGSNPRFLCPKSKIISANTYTSSVDMLLCHFIKSFPNFETVFDKIRGKKNKKKNWLKFFKCCQTLIRLLSHTTETTIWISLTNPSKYWWNSPSTCLFFSVMKSKVAPLVLARVEGIEFCGKFSNNTWNRSKVCTFFYNHCFF
jgi:Ni/Fe-hydrogenase subunit HybB-like protein